MNNNKIFNIILYALLGLSAILGVYFYVATDFNDLSVNATANTGIMIIWCYILFGIATLAAIIFPIITMVGNPKQAKNALIGIVGLAIVFAIGYSLAGNEEIFDANAKLLADASTSKLSGAGIISFYVLGIVSIGVIVFSEVSKIFK